MQASKKNLTNAGRHLLEEENLLFKPTSSEVVGTNAVGDVFAGAWGGELGRDLRNGRSFREDLNDEH